MENNQEFSSNSSQYTIVSPHQQNFPLPSSIIYYITKTPILPMSYRKLQKTCKYFYSKNPIIVVEDIFHDTTNEFETKFKYYSNDDDNYIPIKYNACFPFKIWNVNRLYLKEIKNISKFFNKNFQFDARELDIQNLTLTFEEFLLFTSSSKKLDTLCFFNEYYNQKRDNVFAKIKLIRTLLCSPL